MSGWTCKIMGCFEGNEDGEVIYYRTPSDSYTIPDGENMYTRPILYIRVRSSVDNFYAPKAEVNCVLHE